VNLEIFLKLFKFPIIPITPIKKANNLKAQTNSQFSIFNSQLCELSLHRYGSKKSRKSNAYGRCVDGACGIVGR
jgi:hypothetical protein